MVHAVAKLGDAAGASKAIFVATQNGEEYLVKAKSLCDRVGPYIPANELIALQLAEAIDIPVLPWDFIGLEHDEVGFGLRRLSNTEFGKLSDRMLPLLTDASYLDAIAVLDLWIINTDRHNGNLLCRRLRRGGYQVLATDHSHALVRELTDPAELRGFAASVPPMHFFHSSELRSSVTRSGRLEATLDLVESIGEDVARGALAGVPPEWMSEDVKRSVESVLIERSSQIRALFGSVQHVFPRL